MYAKWLPSWNKPIIVVVIIIIIIIIRAVPSHSQCVSVSVSTAPPPVLYTCFQLIKKLYSNLEQLLKPIA